MLGSIPKARFPESCISDGTSGLGCPARAMRLQGRRKAVAKGSRVSERTSADSGPACGAASAKNNLACIHTSRAAQEALLGSYTGSTAAHSRPSCPSSCFQLSLASAAPCAPLRGNRLGAESKQKGEGGPETDLPSETGPDTQKRGLNPGFRPEPRVRGLNPRNGACF